MSTIVISQASTFRYIGLNLLLTPATMAWVTASKKKKLLSSEILTSITALAAMISRKTIIFKTRIAFRTTYPGPAKDCFRDAIIV